MHPSAPTGPRCLLALLPLLASASLPNRAVGSQNYHHLLGTSMVWPDRYDPRAVIHSRFQATRDGRVFVASPRYRPGVPFTLGTFRAASAVEPDVWPLPASPAAHRAVACRNAPPPPPLVNVVDLWLDDSGDTLWLLDVGVVDTMTDKPSVITPAKVVRLDVSDCSDVGPKTYQTFEIETDEMDGGVTCLQRIVTARTASGCHYAFVSDAGRRALVVLDTIAGTQWCVKLPERTEVVPAASARGRDALYLVPLRTTDGRAMLYATFMYGCRMFAVDLNGPDRPPSTVIEVGRKPFRIAVLGSDGACRMYFRRPAEIDVWSWDVNDPFRPSGFRLASRGLDCRVPAHVAPGFGDMTYVLATNLEDYATNCTGSMGAFTVLRPLSYPVTDTPATPCDTETAATAKTPTLTSTPCDTDLTTTTATPVGGCGGSCRKCTCA